MAVFDAQKGCGSLDVGRAVSPHLPEDAIRAAVLLFPKPFPRRHIRSPARQHRAPTVEG
jgi:hypothetical protein